MKSGCLAVVLVAASCAKGYIAILQGTPVLVFERVGRLVEALRKMLADGVVTDEESCRISLILKNSASRPEVTASFQR